ncbi:MAG: tRNA (adenosine(37)-N6)-threonylcarbamoyltransferase complex dimerization subunit type 1 TsaB [bacterium]
MKLLAFEMSTRHASIALLGGDAPPVEETWEESRAHYETLFQAVTRLLDRAGASLKDIDVFAVGRGPGSFSGVRVALTAARAFALPFGRTVYPVSSGEALAFDILKQHSGATVAVVGDARRGMLWLGSFRRGDGVPACVTPWTLVPVNRLAGRLAGIDFAVSSEWDRLRPIAGDYTDCDHGSAFPTARAVGELVAAKLSRNLPADPPEPLYLHPAV